MNTVKEWVGKLQHQTLGQTCIFPPSVQGLLWHLWDMSSTLPTGSSLWKQAAQPLTGHLYFNYFSSCNKLLLFYTWHSAHSELLNSCLFLCLYCSVSSVRCLGRLVFSEKTYFGKKNIKLMNVLITLIQSLYNTDIRISQLLYQYFH